MNHCAGVGTGCPRGGAADRDPRAEKAPVPPRPSRPTRSRNPQESHAVFPLRRPFATTMSDSKQPRRSTEGGGPLPPLHFRLMTYNIHKGIGGVDRKYRPDRIIAVVGKYNPDIVFLQEVDEGVPRSAHHRQVDLLADALGYHHQAFQRNVKLKKGGYGNAILSRWPLADIAHVDLTVPLKKRRRALVAHSRVQWQRHSRRLLLLNVHLGLAGFERVAQLRRLLRTPILAHSHHDSPVILGGDFNDIYATLGRRVLRPAGFRAAVRRRKTFPAFYPLRALDRVFFRGDLELHHAFAARVQIARQASDHLPLIVDFEMG